MPDPCCDDSKGSCQGSDCTCGPSCKCNNCASDAKGSAK